MVSREKRMCPEMIRAVTERFSLGAVFVLELPNFGLREIASLEECSNLMHLSLAKNSISRIKGLATCVDLTYLNLSYNSITSLEGLQDCRSLERLELQGNQVASLGSLASLSVNTKLKGLYLQTFGFEDSNPVCKATSYRESTLASIPSLRHLDGHRRRLPFIERGDLDSSDVDPSLLKFKFDPKPWVTVEAEKSIPSLEDRELTEAITETKKLLVKGDAILSSLRD
jgi:hypothetical protein